MLTIVLAVAGTGAYFALAPGGSAGGSTLSGLSKWLGPSGPKVLTYEVKRGPLVVTVKEHGALESTNNLEAKSEVEGQTTIIMILAEGTKVTKDQLVCQLDSASLVDNLANQQISTERADADYKNATKTREVAEINVNEYINGVYPQEEKTIQGEIKLAQSELTRAEDRLEWSDDMVKLGYISQAQNLSDRYDLQKSEFNLQQARKKLEVLKDYTYEKQVKSLEGDVEKAKADELAKKSTFELEKEKEEKLRRMIEKCKIYAPGPGIVVYHQEDNRWGSSDGPSIQEGATVRERQTIFKLPDIDNMQVNTKVHESMLNSVKASMSARIRVDAFPNNQLNGEVMEVKPLPDASSFFSSDIKVYTTLVKILNANENLRPGMSAEVEILIARLNEVLSVPAQAIIEYDGTQHVWVSEPEGTWENRTVEVGMTNTKYVEITDGVEEREVVALDPRAVMTEREKRVAFSGGDKSDQENGNWSPDDVAKSGEAAKKPSAREAAAEGKPGGGGPGGGGPGGGANSAMFKKFQNISAEDREKLATATDEEKKAIMKKAGFTDAELEQMEKMRSSGGFGGGGQGGGPGGGGQGGGGQGGDGRRGGGGGGSSQ